VSMMTPIYAPRFGAVSLRDSASARGVRRAWGGFSPTLVPGRRQSASAQRVGSVWAFVLWGTLRTVGPKLTWRMRRSVPAVVALAQRPEHP
jgi:hypothetical protein